MHEKGFERIKEKNPLVPEGLCPTVVTHPASIPGTGWASPSFTLWGQLSLGF